MNPEEDILGKAYDGRLMRRILSYAFPYGRWILLAIVLALFVTVADLSRPYLIKIAIDSHINALSQPMVSYSVKDVPQGVPDAVIDGRAYVRVSALSQPPAPSAERYTVVEVHGRYVLMTGVKPSGVPRLAKGGRAVAIAGRTYPAVPLSAAQVSTLRNQDVSGLETIGILYFFALVIAFGANYVQVYTLQWIGQKAIFAMRDDVLRKVEHMPVAFFDKNPVGRLVTRATNDIEALSEMYTDVMVNFVKDGLMLIGVVIVMFQMSTMLALYSMTILPVVIAATVLYRSKARLVYRNVRVSLARINAFLAENISGMRIVQTFHREEAQKRKFAEVNGAFRQAGMRDVFLMAVFRPFMDFVYSSAVAALVWFGGGGIISGIVTFGVVYAFINYIQQLFQPINDITQKYSILQSAMASSERIFMLLDAPVTLNDPPDPLPMPAQRGEVVFEHVHFAYNPGEWVLRDVDFRIAPGERVAFVGPTGAGKTSIMGLMARFYDVQEGAVRIDGIDVRHVRQAELRRRIAVVAQDVFVFAGTVRQNIDLNHDLRDADVEAAARAVGAHDFIMKLPNGYDEPVQERGSTLSSGQRQLLSFARALAADPSILVLDEATASIDTETEQQIQSALNTLTMNRTTIMVAHRLSTVQGADRIIVLHKGRIREMGSHQELLDRRGLYYDLYRLQYKEDFRLA